MSSERIDVQGVLNSLDLAEVVSRFIQITKAGAEYSAICPFHEDRTPSFRIIPAKQFCYCHACQWSGDAIAFVKEFTGLSFKDVVAGLTHGGIPLAANAPRVARAATPAVPDMWQPICPVPDSAPDFDPGVIWNPNREQYVSFREPTIYTYLSPMNKVIGHVVRIVIDGAKITPQITYCTNTETGEERWCMHRMPRPRSLYGLEQLYSRPDDKVILTEGESCKDAAATIWPGMISISWCGGVASAKHTDWSPLYGRDVVLWPDNDDGGVLVMEKIATELHTNGASVRIVTIPGGDKVKGWDVVDALKDLKNAEGVKAWVKPRLTVWTPPIVPDEPLIAEFMPEIPETETSDEYRPKLMLEPEHHAESNVIDMDTHRKAKNKPTDPPEPLSPLTAVVLSWDEMGMTRDPGKTPHCNEYNVAQILNQHPEFKDKIWYDDFYQSIFSDLIEGEDKEWTEHQTMRMLMWMQGTLQMHKLKEQHVINAVRGVAFNRRRHHLRTWLESLSWDDTPRLDTFMCDAFGTMQNEYTAAVGRCWLVSMVARIFWPGCQADYMPVLEGPEGLRKTSALNALAEPYYAECHEDVHGKAFQEHLQGVWLLEIPELHSITSKSSDIEKTKGIITCRNDRFRAPWAKTVTKHLRQCILSGTTNRDDWNRSDTGARRFWPVRCGIVNDDYIRTMRSQLFAEAVRRFQMFPADEEYNDARVLANADWWNVPITDARREQEARRELDEWEPMIGHWLKYTQRDEVVVNEILEHLLEVKPGDMDRRRQMRVASCLRGLGWVKAVGKIGSNIGKKVWIPPPEPLKEQGELI